MVSAMSSKPEKDNAGYQFRKDRHQYGPLSMDFHPTTLEHLGIKAYTTIHAVISELISNSWDADAENVKIEFRRYTHNKDYTITIVDDGEGMDYRDIKSKFLQIGENRRDRDGSDKTKKNRKVTGRKGIGKLAIFGVVDEIEVISKGKRDYETSIIINLKDMLERARKQKKQSGENQDSQNYDFSISKVDYKKGNIETESGTIVRLTKFKKKRLPRKDRIISIADSICKQLPLVNDDKFSVKVYYYEHDEEVRLTNEEEVLRMG